MPADYFLSLEKTRSHQTHQIGFSITTPQPRNSDGLTVGISGYTDGQLVGINLRRRTDPIGASPVGKSFYRQTLLIPTDNPLE